jgi:serine/threonine protein kinase
MHSKKIMHRDIKPEKIGLKFKDNLNTASIVDFHLAEYY